MQAAHSAIFYMCSSREIEQYYTTEDVADMMISAQALEIAAKLVASSPKPLDRLPYTDDFEEVYRAFVVRLGRQCSRHDCWWYLLDARKRGLVGPTKRRSRSRSKIES